MIDVHRIFFSLDKCGQIVTKIGKVVRAVELPNGDMADIEGWYKYLVVHETNVSLEGVARTSAKVQHPEVV